MKLVMITAEYPPLTGGGVGTFAYELSSELSKLGHDVTVITRSRFFADSVKKEREVKVYRLYSPPIPPKDIWFYAANFWKIAKIIQRVGPDVVHDAGSAIGFMPWIAKKWRVVTTIHGSPQIGEIRAKGSFEDRLRSLAFEITHSVPTRFLTMLMKPEIKVYVYVSRFCLIDTVARIKNPDLVEKHLVKSKVIYNGVNIDAIKKLVSDSKQADSNAMVFIGRLMEYKGLWPLLKAFEKVLEEVSNASLHIVGGGQLYHRIKNFIAERGLMKNVVLHGSVQRERALKILAQSKFLVHPSFYEALPLVVAEAYAVGKPVVVHRAGYSFEMVEESSAGITVDVRNVEEFSKALISLLTDESLYNCLSHNAEKVARKRFDIKVTAQKYESLFEELAG